ncbi:MAG: MATE family efflux transporter [Oscillospiraceae bacterium]|nr:MATE family efflux transporter [Oscillospiraceae bacterium]
MATKIKHMTQGNPLSLIVTFALPLMVGNIFQQLYTVVDTMIVGKALGVDALAALGATDWLYWMVQGMIQGVTQGFAILMAQEFGAKRNDSLRRVVGCSVTLSAICAVLFLLVSQLAARPVLTLLQTPTEIMEWSLLYLRIMCSGIPIVMAYNLLACILRSLGDSKTPLNAMIVAALTNIVLDLLFVLGFQWGIGGAAAATLIAQLCSALFCFLRLRKVDFLTLKREDFALERARSVRLLSLGWPMALQNIMIAVGGMIIQTVVNGYGVAFIAGFTATNKLYGVLEVAATSYGYAMITYVGQNLGANRFDRIRLGMRWAVAVAIGTSLVIGGVMILIGRGVVALFISGTPEEVAQATQVAYQYLVIMSVCLPVLYILHVSRSAVQGMGDTVLPMVSGVAEFVMRTGGVLLLPPLLHETGIFVSEVLAWLGADLILIPSYFITLSRISQIQHETAEE